MLIPKASHLVERVTERLLRSGALDESASQLLQPGAPAAETRPVPDRRSSLFAPAPDAAAAQQDGLDGWPPVAPAASAPQAPLAAEPLGKGAAVHDTPDAVPPGAATPTLVPRPLATDQAGTALQGQLSIDAVSLERAGMVDWSRTRTRISEEFRLV